HTRFSRDWSSDVCSSDLGLTKLRRLAKEIGRDRDLALELWETDVYDARVIALLIDDPRRITRQQAEKQVEELGGGSLAHVFASRSEERRVGKGGRCRRCP